MAVLKEAWITCWIFYTDLSDHCKLFGLLGNDPKRQLILKQHAHSRARVVFRGTDVNILGGCRVLGSVLDSENSCESFLAAFPICFGNLKKLQRHRRQSLPHVSWKMFSKNLFFFLEQFPSLGTFLWTQRKIFKSFRCPPASKLDISTV